MTQTLFNVFNAFKILFALIKILPKVKIIANIVLNKVLFCKIVINIVQNKNVFYVNKDIFCMKWILFRIV